jgi:hypothetical protein
VRVHALATGRDIDAAIARRSPAADDATRTIHVEMDVPDPDRTLPVGTTADLLVDVGTPQDATELPLAAASVRGDRAAVFVIEGTVAHKSSVRVLGERGGSLFVDRSLAAGARVVTEGRALLKDGDHVQAKAEAAR